MIPTHDLFCLWKDVRLNSECEELTISLVIDYC